jgi:hypothetical protein
MTLGILVNQNGSVELVEYDSNNCFNSFDEILVNKGFGEISPIELWETETNIFFIYSWVSGEDFNMFDFTHTNPYGDAIVICINKNTQSPIDINIIDFNDRFESIELNSEDDEPEQEGDDSYDYGDNFLIRDDDGIDYEESFSDDDLY